MIQVIPIRHDSKNTQNSIRTHILHPYNSITIIVTIESNKENIISVLEDHILETLSRTDWSDTNIDADFTFITENYNRFILNLDTEDLSHTSVLLGVIKGNNLTVSTIGSANAYLVDQDEVSEITTPERGRKDFHTFTTGEINANATIYLGSKNLQDILGNGLLIDFANMPTQEFEKNSTDILSREINYPLHIIRISQTKEPIPSARQNRARGQLHLIKNHSQNAIKYIKNAKVIEKIKDTTKNIDIENNRQHKYIFLGVGIVILMWLIYTMVMSFHGLITGSGSESYKKIEQAKILVEESRKLTSNRVAFDEKITKAENILASLRNEEKYLVDIQKLEESIEVQKREVYDIQSIDLSKKTSILPAIENFDPMFTFEFNNKLTIVGKTGLISGFARSENIPKVLLYPNNDEALNAAQDGSGIPYIITKNKKILSSTPKKPEPQYVKVNGQETWEFGNYIALYEGFLYLNNESLNQIYKHKWSANNFANKTNTLPQLLSSKILAFALDGGYYILTEDGKIGRFVSTNPDAGVVSLTINKLPGGWNINPNEATQIIASRKLSYVYIRNGKKMWVMEPNSRDFKSITALNYIAEIEIQSENKINSITIPKDGLFYINTEKGVYENAFEIVESKLILK